MIVIVGLILGLTWICEMSFNVGERPRSNIFRDEDFVARRG